MLIYYRKSGRLANRLWASAHLVAHASHYGYRMANPAFTDYTDLFEGTEPDALCRFPAKRSAARGPGWRKLLYRMLRATGEGLYRLRLRNTPLWSVIDVIEGHDKTGVIFDMDDPSFVRLAQRKPVLFFAGWLFRTKHLQAEAEAVRAYFRPVEKHRRNIDRAIAEAREGVDLLVGVHIRGGDYRTWYDGRFFYTAEQYAAFMRETAALFADRRVGFLVCSDEPRSLEEFEGMRVTISRDGLVEDLYSLAACDLLISSYSTFSQWSSFYGNVPLLMVHELEAPIKPEDFKVALDCALGPY